VARYKSKCGGQRLSRVSDEEQGAGWFRDGKGGGLALKWVKEMICSSYVQGKEASRKKRAEEWSKLRMVRLKEGEEGKMPLP